MRLTAAAILALSTLAGAQSSPDARPPFSDWLAEVRAEAIARGISERVVDQAFTGIEAPLGVVVERDRAQAEAVLPLETYLSRSLASRAVGTARDMFARHRALLEEIGAKYGVSPRIIVAIWGMESNFGRFSGVRPTIAALATLAYDPRRASFFRRELFDALEILNRGDIDLAKMRGSWAGAMGQPQFMPSSYLQYAEDFDGDGRRDIWESRADVFASIANYLARRGWAPDQPWGREVRVPAAAAARIAADVAARGGGCQARRDMTVAMPVNDWRTLGVLTAAGQPLPASDRQAALVGGKTRRFLVYDNYDALLEYNCAHAYALSVGLLASLIVDAP